MPGVASRAACCGLGVPRSHQAMGAVVSASTAIIHMACTQPKADMTAWFSGAKMNWPKLPPALITPAALERWLSGMRCAVAPMRVEKLPAPAPAALSKPRLKISPHSLVTWVVSA